jgi:lysophospholipase L1-like esterase
VKIRLTLALFMARVFADDTDDAGATDHAAKFAERFDGGADSHGRQIAGGGNNRNPLAGARGQDAYHRRKFTQASFSQFSDAFSAHLAHRERRMKNILCFGDSNTWGFIPESISESHPRRHAHDVRWTGILARELGSGFRIIEEGQNGRTTVHDDPFALVRNAKAILPAILESHKPLDLVVLMLGTNDLKNVFGVSPSEIAVGAKILAQTILASDAGLSAKPPRLLLMCPPTVGKLSHLPDLEAKLPNAQTRSQELPRHYEAVAAALGCAYLNTQEIIAPSPVDGIHLDAAAHEKLGLALAAKIKALF